MFLCRVKWRRAFEENDKKTGEIFCYPFILGAFKKPNQHVGPVDTVLKKGLNILF